MIAEVPRLETSPFSDEDEKAAVNAIFLTSVSKKFETEISPQYLKTLPDKAFYNILTMVEGAVNVELFSRWRKEE